MATTLLLVRHGETTWNTLAKIQGCTNTPLAPLGIAQAKLLRDRLAGQFSALYSSPLDRALTTAKVLCEGTATTPIPIEDLKEINFGSWEGLSFKEVRETYPEAYALWRSEKGLLLDGEGSLENCSKRAKACILKLLEGHKDETIVIVSHGGFIKAALIGLLDLPYSTYHKMALGNTCITTLSFRENHPVLMGINDTHHLQHQEVPCV